MIDNPELIAQQMGLI